LWPQSHQCPLPEAGQAQKNAWKTWRIVIYCFSFGNSSLFLLTKIKQIEKLDQLKA